MRAFLTAYARAIGLLGMLALAASMYVDQRWINQQVGIATIIVATIFLRHRPLCQGMAVIWDAARQSL